MKDSYLAVPDTTGPEWSGSSLLNPAKTIMKMTMQTENGSKNFCEGFEEFIKHCRVKNLSPITTCDPRTAEELDGSKIEL